MALEFKKNILTGQAKDAAYSVKQSIDTQINLPDYCSDIKRILKCAVEPGVSSVAIKGEKLTAAGGVIIRLIYINDDDKFDCCETQLDLDVSCEAKSIPENAVLLVNTKNDYVNCRAMSQRRVSVSGSVAVNFTVLSEEKKEFISECDEIETLKNGFKARNCLGIGSKNFDLSETVSLEGDGPDIGKVISADAYCTVDSKKTVTGKMLIKGELVCNVVYCDEKCDSKLYSLYHTMPISQIIDLAGVNEKSNCTLCLKVSRLMVNAKADSSGKKRLFEIAAKITALAKCSEIKELQGVADCYSTDFEISCESENVDFCIPVLEIKENKTASKSYELQGGIKEICHIKAEDTEVKIQFENDSAKILFSTLLSIIYINEKGIPAYAEKSFDFDFQHNVKQENGVLSGEVQGFIKTISWNVTGKNTVTVSADAVIEGEICRLEKKKLCMNITADTETKKKSDNCALILYYPQRGESLWSIAKKYNTTMKLLTEENELKNGEINEGRMLVVPTV